MFGHIIPFPYKMAATAIVVVAIFSFGFVKGTSYESAKFEKSRLTLQKELFDLSDQLSVMNAQNLRLVKEREELTHDLETQALEATGSSNPGVSATGGLQRLNTRWGR